MSPYAYCNGNPVNFTDQFGLYSTSIEATKEAMAKFRLVEKSSLLIEGY